MKFSCATVSKRGGRSLNEDYLGCQEFPDGLGCWVVADGLGGHGGGDVASRLAVDMVLMGFAARPAVSKETLLTVLDNAHKEVLNQQSANTTQNDMRTAIAVFASDGQHALWAHVGDVRVYVFRQGGIVVQTRDHSIPQALADAGQITADEIRGHAERGKLYRTLGAKDALQASVPEQAFRLAAGDIVLICTDGFWEYATELEMLLEWSKSHNMQDWLDNMELRLLNRAPEHHDNYSAIALLAEE